MGGGLDLTPLRGLQISPAQLNGQAAKRPRPERATYPLTLKTLRFECRSTENLPHAHSEAF